MKGTIWIGVEKKKLLTIAKVTKSEGAHCNHQPHNDRYKHLCVGNDQWPSFKSHTLNHLQIQAKGNPKTKWLTFARSLRAGISCSGLICFTATRNPASIPWKPDIGAYLQDFITHAQKSSYKAPNNVTHPLGLDLEKDWSTSIRSLLGECSSLENQIKLVSISSNMHDVCSTHK